MQTYARSCLAAILALGTGCAPDHVTTVRVRDPSAVALEVRTDEGRRTVIEQDDGHQDHVEAAVQTSTGSIVLGTSTAQRSGAGGIALRCGGCAFVPPTPILADDGTIVALGSPAEVIARDDEQVRVRLAYNNYSLSTGSLRAPSTAGRQTFVELSTPASNIAEVRSAKAGYRVAGIASIAAGLALGALGGALIHARGGDNDALMLGSGITGIALGAGLGTFGTILVATPASREQGSAGM